jgi:hypothetical protein
VDLGLDDGPAAELACDAGGLLGVVATPPLGTATPKREKICLAWNSWIFMR